MNSLKIINFFPLQKEGNMLGFASMQAFMSIGNNISIPTAIKVKVMRNSHTGHVFITMPSEKYTAKDGTEKYSSLIYIEKEQNDLFQKAASKAWDEWILSKQPTANPSVISPPSTYYTHGLAKNEKQAEEELPF